MNNLQLKHSFLLFMAAVIWGTAFVAQSVGLDYVGPFTFNGVRCIMGGLVLIPCVFFLDWLKSRQKSDSPATGTPTTETPDKTAGSSFFNKELLLGGLCCGLILCVASNLQQIALMYSSVGKAGFLTALYIILVPVIGILLHRKPGKKLWLAVILALIGLYLLCMKSGDLSLNLGDWLLILCALFFSFHILVIDYFSPKVDGVKMSCLQFLVCGVISLICMFIFETPHISEILAAWLPLVYSGVMSCGVAYTFQILGQKGVNPVVASLIMSLESVVSALAGWIILHQFLSARELFGCVVMFAAIILAQLPDNMLRKKADEPTN